MSDAVSVPVLPDRFVEESLIGAGGNAVVFRAWDHRLGRTVAIKVFVRSHRSRTLEEIRDRELDVTGALAAHPNVSVPIDSGFTQDGYPYVVLEHHPEGSVHDRIISRGPLDRESVLRFGVRLAGALASAHGRGLVHGDVKPANVLLSDAHEPLLADFSASIRSDSVIGRTPTFAAPELAGSATSAPPADVFALGRTLQLALYGFASDVVEATTLDPDHESSVVETIAIAPLRTRAIHRDDPLVRILDSCVEEDPALRPSALELARSFRLAQRESGLELTPVPLLGSLRELALPTAESDGHLAMPSPPGRGGAERHVTALTAVLVAGLGVALVLLGVWLGGIDDEADPRSAETAVPGAPQPVATIADADADAEVCAAIGQGVAGISAAIPAIQELSVATSPSGQPAVPSSEVAIAVAPATAAVDDAAADLEGRDRLLLWILRDTLPGLVEDLLNGPDVVTGTTGDARSFMAAGLAIAERGDTCAADLRSEWFDQLDALSAATRRVG